MYAPKFIIKFQYVKIQIISLMLESLFKIFLKIINHLFFITVMIFAAKKIQNILSQSPNNNLPLTFPVPPMCSFSCYLYVPSSHCEAYLSNSKVAYPRFPIIEAVQPSQGNESVFRMFLYHDSKIGSKMKNSDNQPAVSYTKCQTAGSPDLFFSLT